ncbi:MAG: PQQ-binding-like beta-propeller repeat protein, partial [Candidatus Bathyarchaeia archaeon]
MCFKTLYDNTPKAIVNGNCENPVGVNQEVLIHVGITDYLARADYGWEGLWVTIERPDGVVETIKDIRTDSTGGTGVVYVPRMPGVYRLQAHFPEQVNPVAVAGIPAGTIMEASSSWILELKVLEEPVPRHPGFSPPQEYWTRPINAQLREWSTISGSWLRPGLFYFMAQYAPYNSAPEAPHILWTKPIAMGGLVGGEHEDISFEHGDAYEGKFSGSVIIAGRLYYNQFEARGGTAIQQDVVCVDLHTGEELWRRNWDNRRLSFGQLFYFDSYNYHGVFAYLWVVDGTTWYAYDAFSGRWVYTMTNVPSGTNLYGPKGEIYRYTIDLTRGWMTLWNTSRVVMYGLIGVSAGSWRPHGQTYDARRGIEWNKTIPRGLPGSVRIMWLKEMVVGAYLSWKECVFWALSLKPGEEGRLLFNRTWTPPPGNLTLSWTAASLEDGVFIIGAKETLDWYGFSLRDGRLLWGPTEPKHPYLDYYDKWYNTAVAYGKFFSGRYSGRLHCYDIKTGKLLWTYDLKDTYQEILWSNNWPLGIHFISDGKIYISYMEHSPIQPLRRGAPFVCLDVETGKELWSISIHGTYWGGYAIIGDSILVTFNSYDNRIYAIGKGPTATTVEAPNVGVPVGSTIVIRGTVMDISPGTRDVGVALRFPHGVPAVADE